MNKFLFNEFEEVSAKEWKQKIQADLKGVDYNETLIWKNTEGIDVKPFYHHDDFPNGFQTIKGFPKQWNILQPIFIDDEIIANKLIIDAVNRGAEGVYLTSDKEFNIERIFQEVALKKITIYFNLRFLSKEFINQLQQYFSAKKTTVYYNVDTIENLARTGNWFYNLKQDLSIVKQLIIENPSENILSIDAALFQNAGATMAQQLAYAMAQANEYLHLLTNAISEEHKKNTLSITFKIAIGTNYFFEIAKIRAFRKLYTILAKEYAVSEKCHIITISTKRNKTIYDYNINMLRTSTENMSAILGGANSICSSAYDTIYHKSNEFGERIARNQLLILKEESGFKFSNDPSKGAYYIENLTEQLSEKALQLFKDIEAAGGFLSQLKEGIIQRKIKESAQKEQELFDEDKLELLGTNIHSNPNDQMKEELELFPFVKIKTRKTLLEPIIERRLSEKIEQERLSHE